MSRARAARYGETPSPDRDTFATLCGIGIALGAYLGDRSLVRRRRRLGRGGLALRRDAARSAAQASGGQGPAQAARQRQGAACIANSGEEATLCVGVFEGLYDTERVKRMRARLVALQDVLGDINDATSMRVMTANALAHNRRFTNVVAGWTAHIIHDKRAISGTMASVSACAQVLVTVAPYDVCQGAFRARSASPKLAGERMGARAGCLSKHHVVLNERRFSGNGGRQVSGRTKQWI